MDAQAAMDAAGAVAAVAAAHADETERARRLAPPVVAEFEASGLNGLVVPTALGGSAADPRNVVEVVEALALADASTGWCAAISMGSNFLAGIAPETAARSVFTDVSRGGAGPFAPMGRAEPDDGGYRVTGRWTFTSNCHQAAVTAAGVMPFRDGRPVLDSSPTIRLGLFTADQLEIHETWDTVGMRGSGSHDVAVTDAVLPADRVFTLFDPGWSDDPLYRLRTFDVLGPCLGAVPLGIGRAALDLVCAKAIADAESPPPPGRRMALGDDTHAQMELGKAEVRLRAARAVLMETLGKAFDFALVGDTPPRHLTALIGMANCEALLAGGKAVDVAIRLLGSAAVREGHPLDRLRRDIDTAGAHVMFSPAVMSGLSRELAGVPSAVLPYLPAPD